MAAVGDFIVAPHFESVSHGHFPVVQENLVPEERLELCPQRVVQDFSDRARVQEGKQKAL